MNKTDRLAAIVREIMEGAPGLSESETDELVSYFESQVPHPNASDLIFYPDEHFDSDPTPEEVVQRAMAYRAIQLGPG
ncbi:bacteriocin immunity protein [Promicromonospora sp. NPDC060204]|uniref:bacteriocin immunity protein n=1 Tax=Promicromonospora sp. NPDC060204 TaxID=3347071 RepID=UPI00365643C9